MADNNRRAADAVLEQIEDLIVETSDPKDKAFLLIMNKIAMSLETNTSLTRALSEDFKAHTVAFADHEAKEMALINQGRGGFRVSMFLFALFQVTLGYIVNGTLDSIKTLQNEMVVAQRDIATHREHHVQEERFQRERGNLVPQVK